MKNLLMCVLVGAMILGACADKPAGTGGGSLFLPTWPDEVDSAPAALFRGPLIVQDQCVLAGRPGDFALPVWPKGFTWEQDEAGRVVVRNADGATVATEGQVVEMGGGYRVEFYPGEPARNEQLRNLGSDLGYSIPERCLGPGVYGVWLVGDVEPVPS